MQFGDVVGFFCVGYERFVPDENRTVVFVAQGRTSIVALLISRHRVSGLLLGL